MRTLVSALHAALHVCGIRGCVRDFTCHRRALDVHARDARRLVPAPPRTCGEVWRARARERAALRRARVPHSCILALCISSHAEVPVGRLAHSHTLSAWEMRRHLRLSSYETMDTSQSPSPLAFGEGGRVAS